MKKTEKHSEAFKNSGKAALMNSSLEHESKQTKHIIYFSEKDQKYEVNKIYTVGPPATQFQTAWVPLHADFFNSTVPQESQ